MHSRVVLKDFRRAGRAKKIEQEYGVRIVDYCESMMTGEIAAAQVAVPVIGRMPLGTHNYQHVTHQQISIANIDTAKTSSSLKRPAEPSIHMTTKKLKPKPNVMPKPFVLHNKQEPVDEMAPKPERVPLDEPYICGDGGIKAPVMLSCVFSSGLSQIATAYADSDTFGVNSSMEPAHGAIENTLPYRSPIADVQNDHQIDRTTVTCKIMLDADLRSQLADIAEKIQLEEQQSAVHRMENAEEAQIVPQNGTYADGDGEDNRMELNVSHANEKIYSENPALGCIDVIRWMVVALPLYAYVMFFLNQFINN